MHLDYKSTYGNLLKHLLPDIDPSRHREVINVGCISYESYRVVNLMETLDRHEPDLFVIYTGQNEFLEKRTYDRVLRTPEFVIDLTLLASRLRLNSLLSEIVYGRKDLLATEVDALLDNSVGPEDYHRDDAMRDAVLEHFGISLKHMTSIGQKAGAGCG